LPPQVGHATASLARIDLNIAIFASSSQPSLRGVAMTA